MAFCANCGTQVKGAFCEHCGAKLDAPGTTFDLNPAHKEEEGLPENLVAAACYFLWALTGVLFLVWPTYSHNKRIRFHAFQSIFFSAAFLVIVYAAGVVMLLMEAVFAGFLASTILLCIRFAGAGTWIYLMWTAYQGQDFQLPVLGEYAKKQV